MKFMEETIIPFQTSKGMVVVSSFIGEQEDDLYVWIRFESEEQCKQLYAAVYESDEWKNDMLPRVCELLDTEMTRLSVDACSWSM